MVTVNDMTIPKALALMRESLYHCMGKITSSHFMTVTHSIITILWLDILLIKEKIVICYIKIIEQKSIYIALN